MDERVIKKKSKRAVIIAIIAISALAVTLVVVAMIYFIGLMKALVGADDITADFDSLKTDREMFAEEIINNNVDIDETGWITLPDDKKHISADGICCVVNNSCYDYAVYYMEHNGIIDSSRGYLYKLDELSPEIKNLSNDSNHFVNYKIIDDNWTSCSTD